MLFQTFILAFVISLFGSIPPGTINVTTMKLGIAGKLREAYFLAMGATLIEVLYTLGVVRFQAFISSQVNFSHFTLVTALVMTALGIHSLLSKNRDVRTVDTKSGRKGFAKGIVLGALNPLAIPFWLAVTAYLEVNLWVTLESHGGWMYLAGVGLGSIFTLFAAARLGQRFSQISENRILSNVLPGLLFVSMAAWNYYRWFNG